MTCAVVYENCLFEAAHGGYREVLIRLMALRDITPEHDALGITGKLLLARTIRNNISL